MKILITGATGFIGKKLASELFLKGHHLILLSRNKEKAKKKFSFPVKTYEWHPTKSMPPREAIEDADAVIHLLGENVAGSRWNDEQKKKIYDSRVLATKNLVSSIIRFNPNIKFFISASAVGFYGNRENEVLDERSTKGDGFLPNVCDDWEKASENLPKNINRTIFRIGLVLGKNELLDRLTKIFRSGLGAVLGNGKQWMSWIAIDDLIRAFLFVVENPELSGVYNLTSSTPITNKNFTKTMASHFSRPFLPITPKSLLAASLGEFSTVLLSSQNVIPKRLLESNFKFEFADIKTVLEKYYPKNFNTFYREQFIPKPITEVFDFFSNEKNLEFITPPFLNFKVLNKSTESIEENTLINYELKIRKVPVKWQTKIIEWKPPHHFVDTQLKGPYKLWHHTHKFIEAPGGTFMIDIINYKIPYGIFGKLAEFMFVKNDLKKIFDFRFNKINQHFCTS